MKKAIVGFGLMGIIVLGVMFWPSPLDPGAQVREANAAPAELFTATPAPTATESAGLIAARETMAAGNAQLVELSARGTSVALGATETVQAYQSQATADAYNRAAIIISQADNGTQEARDLELERLRAQATATQEALTRNLEIMSAGATATAAVLEERANTERANAQTTRDMEPYKQAALIIIPGIAAMITILFVARVMYDLWGMAHYKLQTMLPVENDQDSQPSRPEVVTSIALPTGDVDLPCNMIQLQAVAREAIDGEQAFTDERWTGKSGFSRQSWSDLRQAMVDCGLLRWKSAKDIRRGADITRLGVVTFAKIIGTTPPTPPDFSAEGD